ncbi:MAG: SDR family NAD(P)-dependent oxidoreductase [Proteobacteria bacterium]|nr:SDR family NAD(P)-dependent oxidoreductase [Pseudomonadota bacterium]
MSSNSLEQITYDQTPPLGRTSRQGMLDAGDAERRGRQSVNSLDIGELEGLVKRTLHDVIGDSIGDSIDETRRLRDLGLDSVGAMEMLSRLSEAIGQELPSTLPWEYPTVARLAARLFQYISGTTEAESAGQGQLVPAGDEPIAIVGIGCRFPGRADGPDAFWRLLHDGVDAISEVPPTRWAVAEFYHEDIAASGTMNTRWGGFIDSIDRFDPLFFAISPREAIEMDPQQRLALELAWAALEDAGIVPAAVEGTRAGVYIGAMWSDYARLRRGDTSCIEQHTATGEDTSIISGRISYALGLLGPSVTVNTACSSSLVAMHLACRSLRWGETDLALAGGVNVMASPYSTVAMTKFGAMAPDGRCKTFDARANGYVRGEGGGVVVLKRLASAVRDGDRIYCLIRGSATNNDGPSNGLSAPNPAAQEAVLRDAYRDAGVDPRTVHYVEAHGTGTLLGDPIEASALGRVLGRGAGRAPESPLHVGSVKTNIGHLEAAAGSAGVIKTALSLYHGELPASLHFEKPNPNIDFDGLGIRVQDRRGPWPADGELRRAGVSGFGFGGSNCHLVLEQAAQLSRSIVAISAADQAGLRHRLKVLLPQLGQLHSQPLRTAFARAVNRIAGGGRVRTVIGADTLQDLSEGFARGIAGQAGTSRDLGDAQPRVVFVCSGQGGQWLGMGRGLLQQEPVFRAAIRSVDRHVSRLAGWSVLDQLVADEAGSRLGEVAVAQPVIFAMQVGLAALWRSWGIEPDAVLGLSIGEVAAARVAGILSLADACRVIVEQARLVSEHVSGRGAMVVTGLGPGPLDEYLALVGERACRAIDLGPSLTVASGDIGAVAALTEALQRDGIAAHRVNIDYASHSPHMDAIDQKTREALRTVEPRSADIPMYSTTLDRWISGVECNGAYWIQNGRNAVRFERAIRAICRDDRSWPADRITGRPAAPLGDNAAHCSPGRPAGRTLFVELGPHPILARPIADTISACRADAEVVASCRRNEDERGSLIDSLEAMYLAGVEPAWDAVYAATQPLHLSGQLFGATFGDAVAAGDRSTGCAVDRRQDSSAERPGPEHHLVVISAKSAQALAGQALSLRHHVASHARFSLPDIAYSSATTRTHFGHRLAVVAHSRDQLLEALDAASAGTSHAALVRGQVGQGGRLAFVFPGQGSQWPAMGRALLAEAPAFARALRACDAALRPHTGWSLLDLVHGKLAGERSFDSIDVVQPALFGMAVSLAALWRSFGIEPDTVIGLSQGEVAAACVAGALSLEDAALVIARRSQIMRTVSGRGAMAAINLSVAELTPKLHQFNRRLSIASSNGPDSTVVSGDAEPLVALLAELEQDNVFCRPIRVDIASHSPHVEPLRDQLIEALAPVQPKIGTVAMYSTVLRQWLRGPELDTGYWYHNLRDPVLFAQALDDLVAAEHRVFVEISPHPLMTLSISSMVGDADIDGTAVASLRRGQGGLEQFLLGLARLHTRGRPLDWTRIHAPGCRRVSLPTYAWQRQRYWVETAPTALDSAARTPSQPMRRHGRRARLGHRHPLLGRSFTAGDSASSRYWEITIGLDEFPYLAGHKLEGAVVLPGAAIVELAWAAGQKMVGRTSRQRMRGGAHTEQTGRAAADSAGNELPIVLDDVVFERAVVLHNASEQRLRLDVDRDGLGEYRWTLKQARGGHHERRDNGPQPGDDSGDDVRTWIACARGRIRLATPGDHGDPPEDPRRIAERCTERWDSSRVYDKLSEYGLHYGPEFQGIRSLELGAGEARMKVQLAAAAGSAAGYLAHPALLDACFQGFIVLLDSLPLDGPLLLIGADRLVLHDRLPDTVWCHVTLTQCSRDGLCSACASIQVTDEHDRLVAAITGLGCRPFVQSDPTIASVDAALMSVSWERAPSLHRSAGQMDRREMRGGVRAERSGRAADCSIADSSDEPGQWLVLADGRGFAAAVEAELRARSAQVVTIPAAVHDRAGSGPHSADPDALPASLERALQGGSIRGIVYLRGLDDVSMDTLSDPVQAGALGWPGALQVARVVAACPLREIPRLVVVSCRAVAADNSLTVRPEQALLWGLGGCLVTEYPEWRCLRVDISDPGSTAEATALVDEVLAETDEDQVAVRDSRRYVARLSSRALDAGDRPTRVPAGDRPYRVIRERRLTTGPRDRESFVLRAFTRHRPGPGQVEIAVEAAGLGLWDVLYRPAATAEISDRGPQHGVGWSCAGRITAVGRDVDRLRVGDSVVALTPGALGTHVVAAAAVTFERPAALTPRQAAGMAMGHLTACHGLVHVARLQADEHVLIYMAETDIGRAAMHWAGRAGARVLAVAGRRNGHESLARAAGDSEVLDLHASGFAERVLSLTGGRGVDVVFGPLTASAASKADLVMNASGRLIDVGCRGVVGNGAADLPPNRTLIRLDIPALLVDRPDSMRDAMLEVFDAVRAGKLAAGPDETFSLQNVDAAVARLQSGTMVGAAVASLPESDATVEVAPRDIQIRADATYLITGGLGGLGLSVAQLFSQLGATHLLLVSRSDSLAIERVHGLQALRARGTRVTVAWADVGDRQRLSQVLHSSIPADKPLRGIVHAAGLLDDAMLGEQTAERFRRVMVPKVAGAWHLHTLTQTCDLDFFLFYSSVAVLIGSPGQSNYVAANAFMDALAHYRRSRGLAATSINWGPFSRLGLAAADDNRGARLSQRGLRSLTPEDGQQLLRRVLASNPVQLAAAPFDANEWIDFYPQLAGWPYLEQLRAESTSRPGRGGDPGLLNALEQMDLAAARARLCDHVREQAAQVARLDKGSIAETIPFAQLGIDSLMGLELRNRLSASLGINLPSVLVWTYPTAREMANFLATALDLDGSGGIRAMRKGERQQTQPSHHGQKLAFTKTSEQKSDEKSPGGPPPEGQLQAEQIQSGQEQAVWDLDETIPGNHLKRAIAQKHSPRPARARPDAVVSQSAGRDRGQADRDEPIAIVGMACRFPGGSSLHAFWQGLLAGVDSVRNIPPCRRSGDGSRFGQLPRWAGLLDDITGFDPLFFGISPREATTLDPQQRLLLEVAWEALEDAGLVPGQLIGSPTGVFIGQMHTDYQRHVLRGAATELNGFSVTGTMGAAAAGRLSYFFGFQGPSLVVDTACSSSLVALHLACQSLRNRECRMALVGGVSAILSDAISEWTARTQALSPDGRCKPFDASANGFVRGEGCGVVVLERLSDARASGDTPRALIAGSAVNQDGRSTGLTAPNVRSQIALLRDALERADREPAAVSYIETHGTGTSLGDPIEVEAIKAVYGASAPAHCEQATLWLGAVKSNIGHLEAAAGMAGVIKTVLAMQNGVIPGNLHFRTLNPRIDIAGTSLGFPTRPIPWTPAIGRRIAGVSSFGLSGTNGHVLLEQPSSVPGPRSGSVAGQTSRQAMRSGGAAGRSGRAAGDSIGDGSDGGDVVIVLSAQSPPALTAQAARLYRYLHDNPALDLADVAGSLATTRSHFEHRIGLVAKSRDQALAALSAAADGCEHPSLVRGEIGKTGKIVFVFPGQGSQWVGMGRRLVHEAPIFAETLHACDAALRPHTGWSLISRLLDEDGEPSLDRIDVVQPVLFGMAVSLASLWRSWGIEPDMVVGHSQGEIAAACVAGALSLDQAALAIARRSRLLGRIAGQGAMAVIGLPGHQLEPRLSELRGQLSVAAKNSPDSTVVAGTVRAIDGLISDCEKNHIFCRRINVDIASHSPQIEPLREELVAALAPLTPRQAAIPIFSTARCQLIEGDQLDARYWYDNLRKPVRFAQALDELVASDHRVFVEISPHPVLVSSVSPVVRDAAISGTVVATLSKGRGGRRDALMGLARLHVGGVALDWSRVLPSSWQRVRLPTYAWQRQPYWLRVERESGREATGESATDRAAASQARQWLYREDWRPLAPPTRSTGCEGDFWPRNDGATWLIMGNPGPLTRAIIARLEQMGRRSVQICSTGAGTSESASADDDAIDPADYQALRSRLRNTLHGIETVEGVIHLWSIDAAQDDRTVTEDELDSAQSLGCLSAIAVTQALIEGKCEQARLWLVTRGAVATDPGQRTLSVAQAPLWGYGKSIAMEEPGLWGGLVDLAPGDDREHSAEVEAALLVRHIAQSQGEDLVAFRADQRLAARLVRHEHLDDGEVPVHSAASYLITGGLGALGLSVANWLVDKGAEHLVLLGRRGAASDAQKRAVAALQRRGAQVRVAAVDIADRVQVETVLQSIAASSAPLRGVVHAAGIAGKGTVMELDRARLSSAMAAKVRGGWILHRLCHGLPLDFFVCFSSGASSWGFSGFSAYAAANRFLDALADLRRALGVPGSSVNWGLWQGDNMGADEREPLQRLGVEAMSHQHALAALELLMANRVARASVARVDWQRFAAVLDRPLLAELAGHDAAEPVRPPSDIRALLAAAPGQERRTLAVEYLQKTAAPLFEMEAPTLLATAPLTRYGLDSVLAVELRARLRDAGMSISARALLGGASLADLADELLAASTPHGSTAGTVSTGPATACEVAKQSTAERGNRVAMGEVLALTGAVDRSCIVRPRPRPAARVRLFCIPYAGGGPAVFNGWDQALPDDIEVLLIQLPGRSHRIDEPPMADMDEVVAAVSDELGQLLDRPFAFFGHCLGGVQAFEIIHRVQKNPAKRPFHLFVSGARCPQMFSRKQLMEVDVPQFSPDPETPGHLLPDHLLLEMMQDLNFAESSILYRDAELQRLMLPVLRADLAVHNTYVYSPKPRLETPITAIGGRVDPFVTRASLLGWRDQTTAAFALQMRPGDHYFIGREKLALIKLVRDTIGAYLDNSRSAAQAAQ